MCNNWRIYGLGLGEVGDYFDKYGTEQRKSMLVSSWIFLALWYKAVSWIQEDKWYMWMKSCQNTEGTL